MYEVTTAIKTLLVTNDLDMALARAESESKTRNYVEVKEIVSTSPWYTRSVKILMK